MSDADKVAEEFNSLLMRRIEARKALCETAIKAAARLMESQGSVPSRFPELAPLTKAERLIVSRVVSAGLTGSIDGVD